MLQGPRGLAALAPRLPNFDRGNDMQAPPYLDDFGRLLLACVQEDAAATAEQLAEKVPLSSSAIQRRLRRLRDAGVIERQIAVLNPAFLRSTRLSCAASICTMNAPSR